MQETPATVACSSGSLTLQSFSLRVCVCLCVAPRVDAGHCRLLSNIAEIAVRELERFSELDSKLQASESARHVFINSDQKCVARRYEGAAGCWVDVASLPVLPT